MKEILQYYMNDKEKWKKAGDKMDCDCFDKAKKVLSKRFVHIYMREHGFHDWSVVNITFNYSDRGMMSFILDLRKREKRIRITMCDCYHVDFPHYLYEERDKQTYDVDLLIMSFEVDKNGKLICGLGFSDGSMMMFNMYKNVVKVENTMRLLSEE